ncbi:DUF2846 domain-containing protein, partial [Aliiglaciecola sp. 2_MG-2023]|uniref:DUF2846 domain-containing protein n=1 Tax=unclassified Aliiglaciecola TaxID=2593648 RepID=UPI0026E281EE
RLAGTITRRLSRFAPILAYVLLPVMQVLYKKVGMRILALILVTFLAGCATTSPNCEIPRAEGEAATTIVIYRPSAMYGILYSTPFSIDNCRIENLSNNSFLVYKLPAGQHRIAAERRAMAVGGDGVVSGNFEAGKTYYLHYSMSAGDSYYAPGVGVGFTTSTQFYITSKELALEVMPDLISAE